MNNDEIIIKEASVFSGLSTALRGVARSLVPAGESVGKAVKAAKIGEKLIEGWQYLSRFEKIRALRQLLRDAPKLSKEVNVIIGSGANEAKLANQLGKVNLAIVNRLRAIINANKLTQGSKSVVSLINKVEKSLETGRNGISKLHSMMPRSTKAMENQAKINELLKSGKFTELEAILKKSFKGNKEIDGVIASIKELDKVNNIVSRLSTSGVISGRQGQILSKSIYSLKAPGTLSTAISVARATPIVGFVALGALKGDSKEAIKEHSQIINEIIKLLNELPGDNSPAGKAWDSKKKEVISELSEINNINLTELEKINIEKVSLEEAQEVFNNILQDSSIEDRFTNILKGYLTITAPSFYTLYENGSQGMAQTVGETVDTFTGWVFGNVTAFNQAKALAQRGATNLPQSVKKITRDARMVALKIQKHMAENSQSTETTAFDEVDGLVKEAQAFDAIHDIVAVRIKKAYLKKEAAAVLAAIGMVEGWIGGVFLATDLGNFILKTYISMGDGWRDLSKNIAEVSEHLTGFISVDDVEDKDAEKFIMATKEMIQELNDANKYITANFPLDLVKTFEEGVSAANKPTINKLSKEIVNGTASSKLDIVEDNLQKVSDIYDILIDPQSGYYSKFDNTVESYWHGFVEIFDFFTFFTGEGAISEFKRMIYKARRGQAIANTLLNEIKTVKKTFNETRMAALEEASKPAEDSTVEVS